ncbi:MAG: 16S rRNA (guanine(966)-N(2))-methyltransferase RsmD [Actinomycetota bacterium]|nr:16S rRNA (guanine(966)-N(2))-methyltransferase RsmD [Actinomycetota bacterium]
MRVISGSAKGTKLRTAKGLDIRPTADRVKESLFNIIGDATREALVLDLFAGTGALGIESLSRGAKFAYFVDSSRISTEIIEKNLELTKLAARASVLKQDVEDALNRLNKQGVRFDLIFLDPPYRISVSFLDAILSKLASDLLCDDGLLVLEHSAKIGSGEVAGLRISSTRTYGDTAITFYYRKGDR